MNFIRKLVSFIVLVAAIAGLVITCIGSGMNPVWQAFGSAFSPKFDIQLLSAALMLFMSFTGIYIVLILVSFIGLTMPKIKKQK